jgi:hypothetical protein
MDISLHSRIWSTGDEGNAPSGEVNDVGAHPIEALDELDYIPGPFQL